MLYIPIPHDIQIHQSSKLKTMELLLLLLVFLSIPLFFKLLLTPKKPIIRHNYKNRAPSPPSLPILGHLHLFKDPIHRTLQSLSAKHGNLLLLRLGARRALLVSSPSLVQECFTKNDVSVSDRPRMLNGQILQYNNSTVSFLPYGHTWRNHRRFLTLELFSSVRLASFSSLRQQEVNFWLHGIKQSCHPQLRKGKIDLKPKFGELLFNVMTMIIMGKRYYGEDAKNLMDLIREGVEISGNSYMGDYLAFMQWVDPQGMRKKMVRLKKKLDKFLEGVVEEHRLVLPSQETKRTLVDKLLVLQQTEPEVYTDQIIKGMILILLAAGTDTASTTMEWAMALLLNHPDKMEKVRAEIDANVEKGRMLEEQDLPKLKYLHNVIQETLRLHAPVPLLMPREALEDCTIDGHDVARGTMVIINAWAMHRDPKLWEEPECFRPERFEGGEEQYKMVPFGAGRRGCPGMVLANKVMGLGLGTLIQAFEWERVNGDEKIDMSEGVGLILARVKPLEAICTLRNVPFQV